MRFGYWTPIFGGWLRNIPNDEQHTPATFEHLRDIAPPESVQSTWSEVATTMAAGRAAQGLVYGENAAWIATDESKSTVVGKVGVALPPVEAGVMEAAAAGKGYIMVPGFHETCVFSVS